LSVTWRRRRRLYFDEEIMSAQTAQFTLPEGVTGEEFDALLGRLREEIGESNVITDPEALREYRDPYSYRETDEFDASAVVTPTTTDQVQAIVRLANEFAVALWTIGQGRNNTYGGAAPRVRGAIIVSLRTMNKVLEVNDDLFYAVVEPGVRWQDLHDELQARGGTLWSSNPDLAWGSVVGNSLDYGIGYMPNGDHASALCGMEVVLANGDVLRTGWGAKTDSPAAHAYPHAFGPDIEGLFKQSNLGIVTKVGVWLMPRAVQYTFCAVLVEGFERLGAAIDVLHGLMHEGIVTNLPMFTRGMELGENGVPVIVPGSNGWSGRFALYGRPAVIDAQFAVVEEAIGTIEGATLIRKDFAGTDYAGPSNHDERVQRGIPDMDLLNPNLLPFGANTAHLDLSPIGVANGADAIRLQTLMQEQYGSHGLFYVGGILLSKRHALHISTTFYDPREKEQTDGVFAAYGEMVTALSNEGYVPYRTNLQNMDHVADQFDFGDHAQLRFYERLKDALDPNGVLAPGKSGVWPARLRTASSDN
jgi:FAD/FMN-containing dehydrogenase